MTHYIKNIAVVLFTVSLLASCNKSKKYSKRMDGDKWKVVSLTVAGSEVTGKPELLFKDCDIYKESCEGSWIMPNDGRAAFAWQFRDKGKTLEIINQTDHVHGFADVAAADQCIEFSGVYEVIKSKRKSLTIKSNVTHGHNGQEVKMELERKD